MKKIIIDEAHAEVRPFIESIHESFQTSGEWIRDARNQIKRYQHEGYDLCIKSFRKATLLNRVIYSFVRKSKAQRSFEIAQHLLKENISTPEPIAYVEVYNRWHYMTHSYYICKYEDVDFRLSEVLANDVPDKQLILNGFVNFTVNGLYPKGVKHKDFNSTNVLIRKLGRLHYEYMLVDLNRIKIGKPIMFHKGLRVLQKISGSPIYLTELARHYANYKNKDENETIYELLFVKYLTSLRRRYSKRFLHALKL
ncbi:hypothetical protein [Carboxylicivirga sp. RSCT41]|uniref:hypothetical protein n=1 Tax=Carboxylicivirga agarovorans TaxID=3417570 RepID=UPI003D3574BC